MARKRPVPTPASAPSPNLAGLIQACKDEPDDDGLRLILADYLEDHGEPERAELVRLGIQVDRRYVPRPSVAAQLAQVMRLQRDQWAAWLGAVPSLPFPPTFCRGFLSHHLDMGQLRQKAITSWMESVSLWSERLQATCGKQPQVKTLVKLPVLSRFSSLEIFGPGLESDHVKALANGEYLEGIRVLRLPLLGNLATSTLPLFEKGTRMNQLRSLTLTGQFPENTLCQLIEAPTAPLLVQLDLTCHAFQGEGAEVLAASRTLARLRTLALRRLSPGKAGLSTFLNPAAFPQLRALHLREIPLRLEDMRALAESAQLAQLEELSLDHCNVTDEGLSALAESPHAANLRSLSLAGNNINPGGLRALAASNNLQRLERLDLSSNRGLGGVAGTAALFTLDRLRSLNDLSLAYTNVTETALDRLISGPLAPRLRRLRFSYTSLDDFGIQKLAEAPSLSGLETLELDGCLVENPGLVALAESSTLEQLTWLALTPDVDTLEGLEALESGANLPSLTFLSLQNEYEPELIANMASRLLSSPRGQGLFFLAARHPDLRPMRMPFPLDS